MPTSCKGSSESFLFSFFNKESYFYSAMKSLAYSPYKDFIIGIFAGGLEVAADQPLVSLKNILQKNERRAQVLEPSLWKSLTFRQLYAGSSANVIGTSLITGTQMYTFSLAQKILAKEKEIDSLSLFENLTAACAGGLAAAPFASWSEMVMDKYREIVKCYEQKGKRGIKPTYKTAFNQLWEEHSWRLIHLGMLPTICREIGFTASYIAISPYFGEQLKNNTAFYALAHQQQLISIDLVSKIIGSIFAGVIGAAVTHPFDTWKTQRQGGVKVDFWPDGLSSIIRSSIQIGYQTKRWNRAIKQLFHNFLLEPYKGFIPRSTRIVLAVTLLSLVNSASNEHLKKYKP